MTHFIDNIVVKSLPFILMSPYSTTFQYRTRVTVKTFDKMLVIFTVKSRKITSIMENYVHENYEHGTVKYFYL